MVNTSHLCTMVEMLGHNLAHLNANPIFDRRQTIRNYL